MRKMFGVAFALTIGILFVQEAQAQYMSYSVSKFSRESPEINNYLSARYDYLLQVNPRFRRYRMWKECHIINIDWPPLYGDCLASFDQYEPMLPRYRHHY